VDARQPYRRAMTIGSGVVIPDEPSTERPEVMMPRADTGEREGSDVPAAAAVSSSGGGSADMATCLLIPGAGGRGCHGID
jgi:hypothetical protein